MHSDPGALILCFARFADTVDFGDEETLNRVKLATALKRYFEDWPIFQVSDVRIKVSTSREPDVRTVSAEYRFAAIKGLGATKGTAHDTLTVKLIDDKALVTKVRQAVTNREKTFDGHLVTPK